MINDEIVLTIAIGCVESIIIFDVTLMRYFHFGSVSFDFFIVMNLSLYSLFSNVPKSRYYTDFVITDFVITDGSFQRISKT